jgi:hypothetical protein
MVIDVFLIDLTYGKNGASSSLSGDIGFVTITSIAKSSVLLLAIREGGGGSIVLY